MACIYGTHGWGARSPRFKIGTRHHDFCSSFCLLSFIFLFLLTKEHNALGLTYLCNENLHGHGVSDSDKFYIYPLYNYIPVHFGPGPICDSFRLIASHIFTTYLLMASSLIAFNLFHMKQVSNSCYFPPDFDKKMENE